LWPPGRVTGLFGGAKRCSLGKRSLSSKQRSKEEEIELMRSQWHSRKVGKNNQKHEIRRQKLWKRNKNILININYALLSIKNNNKIIKKK
jgi:hypothetical protein